MQPKPAITKLKPTSGKRKATVTITGTGFGAVRSATSFVKFGARKCTVYTSWSPTSIKCKVPKRAAFGRVKVAVTAHLSDALAVLPELMGVPCGVRRAPAPAPPRTRRHPPGRPG